jgi:hypothetical protein
MTTLAHEIVDAHNTDLLSGEALTIKDICIADREKNYSDNELDGLSVYNALPKIMSLGTKMYRAGDTLWLTDDLPEGGVEFHTSNTENGAGLIKNILLFFGLLKSKGYLYAVTHYDFPQINHLFSKTDLKVQIDEINEGKYRTYRAKVSL